MALNNENNPHVMIIPVGSPAADATVLAGLSSGQKLKVLSCYLINAAAIAASDTNYVQISLEKGAIGATTVVAELDSRAAHENGIAQNVPEAMNLVAAEVEISAGELISVNYNETDAGTNVALTSAVVCVNYSVL